MINLQPICAMRKRIKYNFYEKIRDLDLFENKYLISIIELSIMANNCDLLEKIIGIDNDVIN